MNVAYKYQKVAIVAPYWKPSEDFLQMIINSVRGKIDDGDFVTVSEKAISTALGNILDESIIRPSLLARFLAKYWMRLIWGYVLGLLCHLRKKTIRRFRAYPIREGSAHKQVALQYAGFLQALMHGSEGAIDGSNLPYSYVSFPLKNAQAVAQQIQNRIKAELGKKVTVMIIDTDKTYSLRNFHFTPRPKPIRGIHSCGGALAYILGRFFKLKHRATPVAIVGSKLSTKKALAIAEIANRTRGFGAGRTVWDMAETFNAALTSVTWEMLCKIEHKPIVILRRRRT
ncbi:MAG: coenzyme F420-0:L-glutamate ligase [Candidatus Bathyarchaeota archaeon]|nr:coenzyme F420-0:L-glutamate ligase [Candidatus Bathyarchaeota archaeon]